MGRCVFFKRPKGVVSRIESGTNCKGEMKVGGEARDLFHCHEHGRVRREEAVNGDVVHEIHTAERDVTEEREQDPEERAQHLQRGGNGKSEEMATCTRARYFASSNEPHTGSMSRAI